MRTTKADRIAEHAELVVKNAQEEARLDIELRRALLAWSEVPFEEDGNETLALLAIAERVRELVGAPGGTLPS